VHLQWLLLSNFNSQVRFEVSVVAGMVCLSHCVSVGAWLRWRICFQALAAAEHPQQPREL
jgi:cytochrome c-type biogenesis protein CcmH/NrfG